MDEVGSVLLVQRLCLPSIECHARRLCPWPQLHNFRRSFCFPLHVSPS